MIQIVDNFIDKETIEKIERFGSGHINDTYRLINSDRHAKDYLLQRVNHQIFKDVPLLMNNIKEVTNHISSKLENNGEWSQASETLRIINSKSGKNFIKDENGNYWRVFEFLKDYKSYDFVQNADQAYYGAKAFGQFLKFLNDFPVSKISSTIPDFHNIISRLEAFESALLLGKKSRISECENIIAFVKRIALQMCAIEKMRLMGKIPERVTHNDTKFNNVLLSEDNKKSCVIDLDTVMPGIVHYDFGDGVRTSASTSVEDEADLTKVQFDMDKFEGFANGYMEATHDILTPIEIENLALSAPLLSYIMGVRFLTDYLLGDHYYKIEFEGHNLQRATCQLEFTKRMLERLDDMQVLINSPKRKVYA